MSCTQQTKFLVVFSITAFLLLAAYITPHNVIKSQRPSMPQSFRSANGINKHVSNQIVHSPFIHDKSLGVFSDIYVIHLSHRVDRLKRMIHISRMLDIQFTLVNATPANDMVVPIIFSHIRHEFEQAQLRKHEGSNRYKMYLQDALNYQNDPLSHSLGIQGADLWTSHKEIAMFGADKQSLLKGQSDDAIIPFEYDIGKKQHITPSIIACWLSHIRTLRHMINTGVVAALIFEDDIDVEIDLEERIARMWPSLPVDWDIVYLGHCWSKENSKAAIAPNLHPSTSPNCNHAYAVSRRGAMRVLRYLRSPKFAFSRPFDRALLHLIKEGKLQSFSVYPSIAIQTRDNLSDISEGNGTSWRDVLVNGTLGHKLNNSS